MKDPRIVEIEFLSRLEKENPNSILNPAEWAERLDVPTGIFEQMVFALFAAQCLHGTRVLGAPDPSGRGYAGFDPADISTWPQYSTKQSVTRLLNQQGFEAHINHNGRLRLWRQRDELHRARRKDAFELLWDKRHWSTDLAVHLAMAAKDTTSVVLFIDLDDFKSVNEKAGHLAGDKALRMVFQTVLDKIGSAGEAYRWGGDEVSALLPNATLDGGREIGDSIRAAVEEQSSHRPELNDAGLKVTVSVGVGAFRGSLTPDQVTERVAALMKAVKKKGKNSVLAETL